MARNPAFLYWKGMALSGLGEVRLLQKNYPDAWDQFRDAHAALSDSMSPNDPMVGVIERRLPEVGFEYLRSADRTNSKTRPFLQKVAEKALDLVNRELMDVEATEQKRRKDGAARQESQKGDLRVKELLRWQIDLRKFQSELNTGGPN
jgi:hypothetical protein